MSNENDNVSSFYSINNNNNNNNSININNQNRKDRKFIVLKNDNDSDEDTVLFSNQLNTYPSHKEKMKNNNNNNKSSMNKNINVQINSSNTKETRRRNNVNLNGMSGDCNNNSRLINLSMKQNDNTKFNSVKHKLYSLDDMSLEHDYGPSRKRQRLLFNGKNHEINNKNTIAFGRFDSIINSNSDNYNNNEINSHKISNVNNSNVFESGSVNNSICWGLQDNIKNSTIDSLNISRNTLGDTNNESLKTNEKRNMISINNNINVNRMTVGRTNPMPFEKREKHYFGKEEKSDLMTQNDVMINDSSNDLCKKRQSVFQGNNDYDLTNGSDDNNVVDSVNYNKNPVSIVQDIGVLNDVNSSSTKMDTPVSLFVLNYSPTQVRLHFPVLKLFSLYVSFCFTLSSRNILNIRYSFEQLFCFPQHTLFLHLFCFWLVVVIIVVLNHCQYNG